MKNNTRFFLFLLFTSFGFAQVKDISFTLSPFAEYTWWDDKSGLEDGTLIGGKLGFGFGEYVELRAIYLESTDLKTNFDKYGISGYSSNLFNPQDITLSRWGGEFKANIGSDNLNPYINIGTGVQKIQIDGGGKFEQIYTSFGLGIKTKLSDRIVFTIEGKNTLYNFDAGKNLMSNADKATFGVTDADFESELLSNWSIQGALQFYLSGRRPGTLSELDRAYLQKFKGGFKGLRWVVEPSLNYIEFDKQSSFRDSWLFGGYAGLDFNQYTGIRLFYLHAMEDDEISTNFDKFSMYGLEFRARLNDGNGVTPYLILGGGYLNTSSNYLGKNNVSVEGDEFASAGLGLNIPLSKNFLITGGARGMITSSQNVEDLSDPDQLQTHMMYNAGIKLTFGAKSENPNKIYRSQLDSALEYQDQISQREFQSKLESQKAENNKKLMNLKEKYQRQLDSLQIELEVANKENDVEKAVDVLEQKSETKKSLDEVNKVSKKANITTEKETVAPEKAKAAPAAAPQIQHKELIKMTPAELELLIDRILDKTEEPKKPEMSPERGTMEQLNKRIDFLEKLYLQNNMKVPVEKKKIETDAELMDKIEAVKAQSDLNKRKIDAQTAVPSQPEKVEKVIVVESQKERTDLEREVVTVEVEGDGLRRKGRFINNEKTSNLSEDMTYRGASGYIGVNVGEQTTFNIGARMNYGMKNSRIEFMPELYYGIADPSAFGFSGNFIYPFGALKYSEFMTPYAGLGLGIMTIDGDTKVNYNIIIGTNLKIGKGRVFADLSIRNLFKNNQFALGYRLPF